MSHEIEAVDRRKNGRWGRAWPILGLSVDPKMQRVSDALERGDKLTPARYEGATRVYVVSPDDEAVAWETDDGDLFTFINDELVEVTRHELLAQLVQTPESIWAEVRSRVQAGDLEGARGVATNWTNHLARGEDETRADLIERATALETDLVAYIGEASRHTLGNLPRLAGTTRQIAYAESIRGEMVDWIAHVRAEVGARLDEVADEVTAGVLDLSDRSGQRAWLALWGYEEHLRQLEEVLHSETRAKRYIEAHPRGWRALNQWQSSEAPAALLELSPRRLPFGKLVRAWVRERLGP